MTPTPGTDLVDLLARMLVVELGSKGTLEEKAGMVHVALNRAEVWGASPIDVIMSRVEGRPEWGGGCGDQVCDYHPALEGAHRHPAHAGNLVIAARVLRGELGNPIGRRRTFVHPFNKGFARPGGRRMLDPDTGRYLPTWAVSRRHGGQATYEPVDLGTTPTRFA